jgi:hypothetical protein
MNWVLVALVVCTAPVLSACSGSSEEDDLVPVSGRFLQEAAPAETMPIGEGMVVLRGPVVERLEVGKDGTFKTELPDGHYEVYGVADEYVNGRPGLCPLPRGVEVSGDAVEFDVYCHTD